MQRSSVLFNVTKRLLYTKFRDLGDEPELSLFGKLKRIIRQWMDGYLHCRGSTFPAQFMHQDLADRACEKITAGITRSLIGTRLAKADFDPYSPTGSTSQVSSGRKLAAERRKPSGASSWIVPRNAGRPVPNAAYFLAEWRKPSQDGSGTAQAVRRLEPDCPMQCRAACAAPLPWTDVRTKVSGIGPAAHRCHGQTCGPK